ncbi:MAG: ABC transporter permease, partial [Methylococcaceae bacterium]|nr:ABC transporter permease [Methylococcaceae bacterium]
MIETSANSDLPPNLLVDLNDDGQLCVRLTGSWNLRSLAVTPDLQQKISLNAANKTTQWDMRSVDLLDSAAAL